jgi:hypothetical protein
VYTPKEQANARNSRKQIKMATILSSSLSRSLTLSRQPSDYDAKECPICFEVNGGEIIQLQHATNQEAIKTHKACVSCRLMLKEENAPCPWCRDTVLYVAAGAAMPGSMAAHIIANPAEEEKIELPEGIKQSPCCGILVQRISGSAEMMCGCEARPAGGTLFKALRGGGCGHEWNWDSGAPIAYGAPGNPAHPRQTRFHSVTRDQAAAATARATEPEPVPLPDVPSCAHGVRADDECEQCPPPWALLAT